jgi:hypothetical protein
MVDSYIGFAVSLCTQKVGPLVDEYGRTDMYSDIFASATTKKNLSRLLLFSRTKRML